jgi:hypothetical protein
MTSCKSVGRLVGVLLLLHLALGLTVPFIMLLPLVSPPGFLSSAAGIANQTRTGGAALLRGQRTRDRLRRMARVPRVQLRDGALAVCPRGGELRAAGSRRRAHPLHAVVEPGVR